MRLQDADTLESMKTHVAQELYRKLADFEDHLDDIKRCAPKYLAGRLPRPPRLEEGLG